MDLCHQLHRQGREEEQLSWNWAIKHECTRGCAKSVVLLETLALHK
jgi:hypothetical protein